MSSIPNMFNIYGDDTTNHRESFPIKMNHNSKIARSMFSCPPSFSSYQTSHVSSCSVGFNNSHMTYHMKKKNFDFVPRVDYFPTKNNFHFTQVSFNQTIINRYSSIFPINTCNDFQCDIEHVKRALDSSNISNPIFHRPNSFNTKCKILNPTPLNIVFLHQDSIDHQHLHMITLLSKHNRVSQGGRSLKKVFKPTNLFEKPTYYIDFEEDEKNDEDQYDGRTHSLPYENTVHIHILSVKVCLILLKVLLHICYLITIVRRPKKENIDFV
ncbi:hypothetical protein AtEden1_Chr5g0127671 [Arabidopsis thaliana]